MMQLEPHHIHFWTADLSLKPHEEEAQSAILSLDERNRAKHLRFPDHKRRFIASRSALRHILAQYLNKRPEQISFHYSEHNKPFLPDNRLQFNLAHSKDLAVYAVTLDTPIGIDIEKIQEEDKFNVAARFFSDEEKSELAKFSGREKIAAFYQIWSRKEALIKANGKGLTIPLSSFSVSLDDQPRIILLDHQQWTIVPLDIHPDYAAATAVATNQPVGQLIKNLRYNQFLFSQGS